MLERKPLALLHLEGGKAGNASGCEQQNQLTKTFTCGFHVEMYIDVICPVRLKF